MRLIENAISDPDVSGIVICGAAGVGKSRVAREALAAVGENGHDVRWVVGTNSGRAVPLGALAEWVGPDSGGDNLRLVREVIASLTCDAPGPRAIVAVDDAPLLDEFSTFVVGQVIQRHAATVVLTVRDDESLTAATTELWERGQFERLDLGPLSRGETTALVSAAVGGALEPDAARRLWELTRGNVLYLRNIVEQEVAEGRIVEQRGFWRWVGDPVMAPGLVEHIESRIGALPTSVSDVIDTLAVGEPIELGALTRMSGAAAVEEADLRGLITLDHANGRIEARVAHPLYGEVRRNRAAPTRLRRLRGLVARELAESEDRDELRVVVRRAALSLDSDLERDADLLLRAARGAICARTTPPQAQSCVHAFLAVYWAAMGKPEAVAESSKKFVWDQLPDNLIARLTAWALTVAAGEAGRMSEAVAAAQAGYPVPIRSFVIITDGHTSALLLAGEIARARYPAQLLGRRAADIPDSASQFALLADGLAGRAHLGAGELATACSLLEPIVGLLIASGDPNRWGYRCRIPHTTALAMRGFTEEAAAALTALDAQRHPGWQYLDYEYSIAKAWVAASQGAVSEAIATVLLAAETACGNEQFAAEVMCLQTATQFGDPSGGPRLRALEAIVEGSRVGVAARFAVALHSGDAPELARVSEDFERMGDLVAAVDAAAHAALVYRRQDCRGSSLRCSTRAEELAHRCGGAVTPALRQAAEPLPLTDREREVVMLIGKGMSNRAIAARLTVSTRTVETHVYHAMTKTGTATRDHLAELLTPLRAGEHE